MQRLRNDPMHTTYFTRFLLIEIGIGCSDILVDEIALAPNEVVIEADAYVNGRVIGLALRTSNGHEYGPYGWTDGDMFTSRGSRLNGFAIAAGPFIQSISFIWDCDLGMISIRPKNG